jgi:hypothetical protein
MPLDTTLNKKPFKPVSCPHCGPMVAHTVNGLHVRNHLDVGFSGGGHHLVEDYIPEKEIWIDECHTEPDRLAYVHHEMTEHMKMAHEGYDEAHQESNQAESKFRQQHFGVPAPHKSDAGI